MADTQRPTAAQQASKEDSVTPGPLLAPPVGIAVESFRLVALLLCANVSNGAIRMVQPSRFETMSPGLGCKILAGAPMDPMGPWAPCANGLAWCAEWLTAALPAYFASL